MDYNLYSLPCTVCKISAITLCSRCYVPYCSFKCQINNWPSHKKLCKPSPPLFDIETVENAAALKRKILAAGTKLNPPKFATLKANRLSINFNVHKDENCEDAKAAHNTIAKVVTKSSIEPVTSTLARKIYTMDSLQFIELPEGKNVPVIVIDSSFLDSFIITVMKNEGKSRYELNKNLTSLWQYCEKVANDRKGYKPQMNEICLALFDYDDQWYRAFCVKELYDTKFMLQFIDFGNVLAVSAENIMPITEQMLFPTCTHLARVTNIQLSYVNRLQEHFKRCPLIEGNIHFNKEQKVYNIYINNLETIFQ